MAAWIYQRTNWIVDRDDPRRTFARLTAIVLALLPLVLGVVIVALR